MKRLLQQAASKAKAFADHCHDVGYNRKLVGNDRNGNKYYQYFASDGKEDKREVEIMSGEKFKEYDPYWDEWLRYRQKKPFTEEELKKFYQEDDNRVEAAFKYEKKDAEMMKNFRAKYKKENTTTQTSMEKGFNDTYEPGYWQPGSKR